MVESDKNKIVCAITETFLIREYFYFGLYSSKISQKLGKIMKIHISFFTINF